MSSTSKIETESDKKLIEELEMETKTFEGGDTTKDNLVVED